MSYLEKAQARARRRKSPWNLMLPVAILPVLAGLSWLGFELVWLVHVVLVPQHDGLRDQFWTDGISFVWFVPSFLMMFAPFPANLLAAFIVGNWIVWLIPGARRAFDREAGSSPALKYSAVQRRLASYLGRFAAWGYGVAFLGALLLRRLH